LSLLSKVQLWRARRELRAKCLEALVLLGQCELIPRVAFVQELEPRKLGIVLRDAPRQVVDRLLEALSPTAADQARATICGRHPTSTEQTAAVEHVCAKIESVGAAFRLRRLERDRRLRSVSM
jgi:hypothetical protein